MRWTLRRKRRRKRKIRRRKNQYKPHRNNLQSKEKTTPPSKRKSKTFHKLKPIKSFAASEVGKILLNTNSPTINFRDILLTKYMNTGFQELKINNWNWEKPSLINNCNISGKQLKFKDKWGDMLKGLLNPEEDWLTSVNNFKIITGN